MRSSVQRWFWHGTLSLHTQHGYREQRICARRLPLPLGWSLGPWCRSLREHAVCLQPSSCLPHVPLQISARHSCSLWLFLERFINTKRLLGRWGRLSLVYNFHCSVFDPARPRASLNSSLCVRLSGCQYSCAHEAELGFEMGARAGLCEYECG